MVEISTEKQRGGITGKGFTPGVSGNPLGRPKGSISIKDKVRQYLEEHPEEMQNIVGHFVHDNRELMWQMLEGRPQQTIGGDGNAPIVLKVISYAGDILTPQLES